MYSFYGHLGYVNYFITIFNAFVKLKFLICLYNIFLELELLEKHEYFK